MITPRFQLNQDDLTVTIIIRAPYCNLRELEVCVEDDLYLFVCKPYYLRLNLPGKLLENDNTKSSFDSDSGEFTFTYDKLIPNETFPDLDLITKLMPKKIDVIEGDRKIEILTSEKTDNSNDSVTPIDTEHGYGFALRGGYSFSAVNEEFIDVFDVDPFKNSLTERHHLRLQDEQKHFNIDHYLGDLMDDEEVNAICKQELPYNKLLKEDVAFTDKELDFLKDLHNIEHNLTEEQANYSVNSLVDILFAYCYDRRTTYYEGTCESGWTIAKLSASLSWFDAFKTPREALVSAFRRSLIYPLYRSYNLSNCVLNDLKILLNLGEKMLIKSLINIYEIFLGGDCGRYILNNLFIKDYIIYIMKWDKDSWLGKVNEIKNVIIKKEDLGLNLIQVEELMNDVSLVDDMLKLNIKEGETDSDDEESDDSIESSSSESDDSDTSSEDPDEE